MSKVLSGIILLLLIVLISYSNTFNSPPVLDDFHSFVRNAPVHIDSLSLQNIQQLSNTQFGISRFIPMVTFGWDYWWGSGEIYAFHVTNLIIHVLCALVLFILIQNLLAALNHNKNSQDHRTGTTSAIFLAFAVTALWALNPVQTNAVTYLVQRMASIQALFFAAAVAFYVKARLSQLNYKRGEKHLKTIALYSLCGTMGLCAFLSKENARMLPAMILLTEIWFFRPHLAEDMKRLWARIKRTHWVYWCMAILVVGWICFEAFQYISGMTGGYRGRHFTLEERLLTQARIVVWYMSLLLLPLPSRLSLEHDVVLSTSLFSPITTILSILFIGVLIGLIIRYRRAYPLITYGGAWFFLNLFIESSFVPLELVFEHRLYLPSMGFFMVLVFGVAHFVPRWFAGYSPQDRKRLSWCVLAIFCSVLSLMTFQRNEAWRDILTINHDNVVKAPNNPRAHANYAVALLRAGYPDEAIRHAERTLELGRHGLEDHVVAANAIVGAHMEKGLYEEAVRRGEDLLNNRPPRSDASSLPILKLRIADSHRELGNLAEAYQYTIQALDLTRRHRLMASQKSAGLFVLHRIVSDAHGKGVDLNEDGMADPGDLPRETWMARLLLQMGDRQEGRRLLERAFMAHPECRETMEMLALVNWEDRMTAAQASTWKLKDKLSGHSSPKFAVAIRLADRFRRQKLPEPFWGLGERLADHAINLQRGSADARLVRGWFHYERKQFEEAVMRARQAIELEPQYAKAWLGLGYFLAQTGQNHEALVVLQHALTLYPGYPQRRVLITLMEDLQSRHVHSPLAGSG